jgi:dienelactone hydrolase
VDAEEASHLMDNLDFPGAVQDVAGAAAYLRSTAKSDDSLRSSSATSGTSSTSTDMSAHDIISGTNMSAADFYATYGLEFDPSHKVGVMGFCMGGALTLASTVSVPGVDCGIVFYGISPDGLADPTTLCKPLQCHFGNDDNLEGFSDASSADELEAKLMTSPAASMVDFNRYDGVGHAFINDLPEFVTRKSEMGFGDHSPDAANLAWERSAAFLGKHLLGGDQDVSFARA